MRKSIGIILLAAMSPAVAQAQGQPRQMSKSEVIRTLEQSPVTKVPPGGPDVLNLPTIIVCAGQHPSGWAVQDVSTNFTVCGGGFDNVWTLVDLRGAGSGRTVTVCSFSAANNGWVTIGTSTDFTRCGRNPGFNNITTIRKL